MKKVLRKLEIVIALETAKKKRQKSPEAKERDFWLRKTLQLREQLKRLVMYKGEL